MNKVLKLSDTNEYDLPARDIAAMHYGYYLSTGKVTYTTDKILDNNADVNNILLMVGNKHLLFYWCHVECFYSFGNKREIHTEFDEYSPVKYKSVPQKKWILFDKMELIPQSFTDTSWNSPELIKELIKNPRMNHKNI